MNEYPTVGVDLGGTGTRLVLLARDGTVLRERSFPTPAGSPVDATAVLLNELSAVTDDPVTAVGVGASGPIRADGTIENEATLPAFSGVDLIGAVRDRFGWPCLIENDAAAAAMGEYTHGAGGGTDNLLMVTLGTGIGVAAVHAGRLVRAGDGSHPEGGHITVGWAVRPCYCGLPTCWEQAASRTAFELVSGTDMAHANDDQWSVYGQRVASGVATLLTLYRPALVVIGGSGGRHLDRYRDAMTTALARAPGFRWLPAIAAAALGDVAGAVGAAALARSLTP